MLRQFNKRIKIFHSKGDGEFVNIRLSSHLLAIGTIHQVSCPYTLEPTGVVERQHRVIREVGMTMFFHSQAPLYLWIETLTTVVFLPNGLPSSSLGFETSYFKLHGTHPDYSCLCIFRSKCFSYTWDTKRHKFDLKSVLYVFVGYSDKYKGYKCFHPTTKKIFISRHVVFDKTVFPFKLASTWSLQALRIFNSWLSLSSDTNDASFAMLISHTSIPISASVDSPMSTNTINPGPELSLVEPPSPSVTSAGAFRDVEGVPVSEELVPIFESEQEDLDVVSVLLAAHNGSNGSVSGCPLSAGEDLPTGSQLASYTTAATYSICPYHSLDVSDTTVAAPSSCPTEPHRFQPLVPYL